MQTSFRVNDTLSFHLSSITHSSLIKGRHKKKKKKKPI